MGSGVREIILIPARLMAAADVFHARILRPVYNAALSFATARDLIFAEPGRRFDTDVTMPSFISLTTSRLSPESSPLPGQGNPARLADSETP